MLQNMFFNVSSKFKWELSPKHYAIKVIIIQLKTQLKLTKRRSKSIKLSQKLRKLSKILGKRNMRMPLGMKENRKSGQTKSL